MKAKRGDIAVIVTEQRDVYIGQEGKTRTRVEVTQVTSITRDGVVKAVRDCWEDSCPQLMANRARHMALYVVPAAEFDVAAAMESARNHAWPNSTQPRDYDSVVDVKAMLRTHRKATQSV